MRLCFAKRLGCICSHLGRWLYPRDHIITGLMRSNAELRTRVGKQYRLIERLNERLKMERLLAELSDEPRHTGFPVVVPSTIPITPELASQIDAAPPGSVIRIPMPEPDEAGKRARQIMDRHLPRAGQDGMKGGDDGKPV